MRNLALIIVALLGVASYGSWTQASVPDPAAQQEIARLDSLLQELQAQAERIKDLEDDLEDVITFLGNEMGY